MNEANGPPENTSSEAIASQVESRPSQASDPEATIDSSGAIAFSAMVQTVGTERKSIGPYQLIRKLGEGGMGQVWLADQKEPIQRQVALKLIRVGVYDDAVLQRFYAERRSLAMMDHPSIAKVFDAGATPDGQPYFVMEYVPGLPITDYCDRKRLNIHERLELFMKVCEGVQHAHQKALIHRDLKPANILVVEVDGKPVPRLIDFGLAKAVSPELDGETLATKVGEWVGTPGYMSPEQADAGRFDVDTRTDVYSLGVVLYVLLTGFLPFETKNQRLDEFLRRLREEDPLRPSTRVGTEKESSKVTSEARGAEPGQLVSLLHGDLDWITVKALEKDRARRYGTPMELAIDIGRYLNHEPIVARPASTSYRLRKYVRRHRLGVAVAVGLVIVLVAFGVNQAIQVRRITRERDRATRERDRANRIADFMKGMFQVSDPSESRGSTVTAREILDKGSEQIEKGLGQDPLVQARLMQTMGATYRGLGLYDQAHTLLEHAVAIQKRELGAENPETLRSMSLLGVVLEGLARREDSETVLREALAGQQKVLGPEAPETMDTVGYLSDTLTMEGHLAEAEGLIRRTLVNQQQTLGPENPSTLRSMRSLCRNLHDQGRLAEAEKLDRETIAVQEHALGADHPGTLWTMNQLALVLQEQGRYAEAENLFRETLFVSTRVLGPDHDITRAALANVGLVLQQEGHLREAEAIQRQELAATRSAEGSENPDTLDSMNELGITLGKEHKLEESEKLLRASLATAMRTLGPADAITRNAMADLASTLAHEKREKESTALFEKLVAYAANAEGTAQSDANYQYAIGMAVLGHKEQALDHLQKAVQSGFANASELTSDKDLQPLRDDPRFQALVNEIQRKQAAK